ncbi:MAG: cadherin-like beta sandwich domain-containing protein, partial [Sphingobacteriales bacterium]
VSSASMYRFRIADGTNVQTFDAETNSFKFTQLSSYENSTSYTIDVKVEAAGTWMDYGATAVVTTPFPITQISETFSGKTLLNTDSVITADPVPSATGYRLRVTKNAAVQTLDAPTNEFKLKELGDYDYNTTYSMDVAVKKGAAVGTFGAASLVSTPAAPITKVTAEYCGASLRDVDGFIQADAPPLATAYHFRVRLGDSVKVIDELVPSTLLYKTNFYAYGTTYTVDVSAYVEGTWSEYGASCQITSWPSPRTQLGSRSCGKILNPVGDIFADNVPTATNYRFKITQGANVQYIESTVQGVWLSDINGYAYNTTYSIEVTAKVAGDWLPYGAACNVTTGPATTQITPPYCGRILTDVIGDLRADRLPGATAYRFRVTQGSNVGVIEETGPSTYLSKTNFYAYNTTYSVTISALLNDTWTEYGPACNVTSMANPHTQLSSLSCGKVLNKDGDIRSDGVPTATSYRFRITQGTNPPQTVDSQDIFTKLANMPGYAFNTVYSVETAALVKDVWTPYGVACNVTTAQSLTNANLAALTLSAGTLSPVFDPATLNYTASVINAAVALSPTVADTAVKIKVNGATVASGSPSGSIPLNVGNNTITTIVTARDNTTTKTYTVNITRLSNIAATTFTLSPASKLAGVGTGPAMKNYKASVAADATTIMVKPKSDDPNATVTVNGTAVTRSTFSDPIALTGPTTMINMEATAEDGITKITYSIEVSKSGSNNADLGVELSTKSILYQTTGTAQVNYKTTVDAGTQSIMVKPRSDEANAVVTVNGTIVPRSTYSAPIPLTGLSTIINMRITAQDGV